MKPVAYRWRCQIEENAKQLAFHHEIPEMNHNEIVGWTNVKKDMVVILVRDNKEENHIRDRFNATKKLAWLSQDIEVIEIFAKGNYPLTRIISSIYLGDLISLKLAKLNNINPTPVEIIEKLKGELGGK
jgi:glucose/mannose-6-phosphate isomerase